MVATVQESNDSPARRLSRRGFVIRGSALLGAGVTLAACGAGGAPSGAEKPADIKGPVTLRWSTWGDDAHPFNTDAAPKGMALFNQKFPNIKVSVEPQNTGWEAKNTTEWIAGTGPDLSGHCCSQGPAWGSQGLFMKLDPYLKRDAKAVPTQDYVEWLMKLFATPNQAGQWALPMYTGTVHLFYNKSLFQKKGLPFPDETWDWNKWRDTALKVAEPQNNLWARVDIGNGGMYKRLQSADAHIVDPNDNTKAAFATDKAIAAFEFERGSIYKDKTVAPNGGPNMPDALKNLGFNGFGQQALGRVAMWEGGSFTITRYIQYLSDQIDWDMAPLPKGPTGRVTLATSDGWSIWNGTKNKDASWELLKFLQSDEWTDIATRVAGQQSARKSYQQKWLQAFKEANPKVADKNLKWAADAIEKNYARPIEFFLKDDDSKKVYTDAYNNAVRDGMAEVGATMKAAVDQINQINKG